MKDHRTVVGSVAEWLGSLDQFARHAEHWDVDRGASLVSDEFRHQSIGPSDGLLLPEHRSMRKLLSGVDGEHRQFDPGPLPDESEWTKDVLADRREARLAVKRQSDCWELVAERVQRVTDLEAELATVTGVLESTQYSLDSTQQRLDSTQVELEEIHAYSQQHACLDELAGHETPPLIVRQSPWPSEPPSRDNHVARITPPRTSTGATQSHRAFDHIERKTASEGFDGLVGLPAVPTHGPRQRPGLIVGEPANPSPESGADCVAGRSGGGHAPKHGGQGATPSCRTAADTD